MADWNRAHAAADSQHEGDEKVRMTERTMPGGLSDERGLLDGWLEYYRATLLAKCEGLSGEQLVILLGRLGSLRPWKRDRTLTAGLKIRGRLTTPSPIAMPT
jgi:hypothetical protein